MSITTTTSTNFGGIMAHILYNNSNENNNEPVIKTETVTALETKNELIVGPVSRSVKGSSDSRGVSTVEFGGKIPISIEGIPVVLAPSQSLSSNGETKSTIQATTGTPNLQGGAMIQYGTDGNKKSVTVGVVGQGKSGKTTVTTSAGIKFNW